MNFRSLFLFKKTFLLATAFLLLVVLFSSGRVVFLRSRVASSAAFLGSIFSRAGAIAAGLLGAHNAANHERVRLFSDAAELASLRVENKKLRTAFRLGEVMQKKIILARIVGIGREIGDEYVLVDKGEDDGIGLDFTVLGEEKLLFGRVVEVFSHTARVRLISSPQEVVEAIILPSGIRAVSRGRQSGEFALDLVPRESDVAPGDAVVTAEQSRYGGGWVIGEVAYTSASDSAAFQTVLARHLFSPLLSSVFVVIP